MVVSKLLTLEKERERETGVRVGGDLIIVKRLTNLMSMRSNHLSTSGPSSFSERLTASLAMTTAAISWS